MLMNDANIPIGIDVEFSAYDIYNGTNLSNILDYILMVSQLMRTNSTMLSTSVVVISASPPHYPVLTIPSPRSMTVISSDVDFEFVVCSA